MMGNGTVLVTGGASGIGRAVVAAILEAGGRVVVADMSAGNLDEARSAFGTEAARFVALDVSDEEAVVRAVAEASGEAGPLIGLVNSAGIGGDVPALETSAALFRKILDVNVIGSFLVAREAAKAMREAGRGGAIVNIASVSGLAGNEGRTAYGASKGAVLTMTKVMAVEFAPLGIRVNAVAPGPIETPLVAATHTPEARAGWLRVVPQRRYGRPEDIAAACLFLLDEAASGYITGETLCVDGGFMAAGMASGTATGLSA